MRRLAAVLLTISGWFPAQLYAATPTEPQQSKTQIADVVREISPKNIEATIRKLVSFGTRHTLSETASETHGIGAARKWIQSELARYSSDSAVDCRW